MVQIGERTNATPPDEWDMECVREIMCEKDNMAKAKKLKVIKAAVFFDDQIYKDGKWQLDSKQWGGSASGNEVKISKNTDCEGAANTIYHEVLHTGQPDTMSWLAQEMEAYTKTEEWLIARGLSGRDAFRTVVDGKTVVSTSAIESRLTTSYPLGITERSKDGSKVKDDGVWRAVKNGDKMPGPQRLEGMETIDPEEFDCPSEKSESDDG